MTVPLPSQGDTTWYDWATQVHEKTTTPQVPSSHTHGVTDLTATGTRSSSTYLRGDNTWATPAGGAAATGLINVKDYGALGDGTTDDSAAIAAARNAALATRNGNKHASRPGLYFPSGSYLVTVPDTLMNAVSTAQDFVEGWEILGDNVHSTEILFQPTGSTATLTGRNLMTFSNSADGGRVRSLRISKIKFRCNNSAASFLYSYSQSNSYFHDGIFKDVMWTGTWTRVVGLDGTDANANLNSEVGFENCALDVDSTFADAFFVCAVTPASGSNQQDQFVNYWFRDCRFAWLAGTLLKFPKGGSISVSGGSWSMLGATCLVFHMPFYLHNNGAQRLLVQDLRLELNVAGARTIDCEWFGGQIDFISLDESPVSWQSFAPTNKTHRYDWGVNNTINEGPVVNFHGCSLSGYHEVATGSTALNKGKLRYMGCTMMNYGVGQSIQVIGGANGLVRWTGSARPFYVFRECQAAFGPLGNAGIAHSGTTALRPTTANQVSPGDQYFDTTLGKPIWWNGTVWKDAAGTTV